MIPAIVVIVIAVRGVMMMRTLCRIASHVGNGSKREVALLGLMSASPSCGHNGEKLSAGVCHNRS